MLKREIVALKYSDIVPYMRNPRKNDKTAELIKESIKQVGYINPIIVNESNEIIAGHARYKALKGNDVVNVIRISGLDEEQIKKYRILDNKTGEIAFWDYDKLCEELIGLDFGTLNIDFGIEQKDDTNTEYVNKEYSLEAFGDETFKYECPHCGFRFNDK